MNWQGAIKGRGTHTNPHNRFQSGRFQSRISVLDVSAEGEEPAPHPASEYIALQSRSIVSSNKSPDVPFRLSVNPYQGCEHGCVYCFARPTHEYLDLSLGLDFETKIHYKQNAASLLASWLARPGYQCEVIAIGANTDPYQQAERQLKITRSLLEVMRSYRQPVSIITKGSGILRDLDILSDMAKQNLVNVMITVTSLDPRLKNILEPRAASPVTRLRIIDSLAAAKIPVGVLIAPVIPAINDTEIEKIIRATASRGAQQIGYVMLRLPFQLKELFTQWLQDHYPRRKNKVLKLLAEVHGGRLYRSQFGKRQQGSGVYADLISQRVALCCQQNGINLRQANNLRTDLFQVPDNNQQLTLF